MGYSACSGKGGAELKFLWDCTDLIIMFHIINDVTSYHFHDVYLQCEAIKKFRLSYTYDTNTGETYIVIKRET